MKWRTVRFEQIVIAWCSLHSAPLPLCDLLLHASVVLNCFLTCLTALLLLIQSSGGTARVQYPSYWVSWLPTYDHEMGMSNMCMLQSGEMAMLTKDQLPYLVTSLPHSNGDIACMHYCLLCWYVGTVDFPSWADLKCFWCARQNPVLVIDR